MAEKGGNKAKEDMDATMADINQMSEAEVSKLYATVNRRKGWVTQKRNIVTKNKTNVERIRDHNNQVDAGTLMEPRIDADQARETVSKLRQSMTELEAQMLRFEVSAKKYIEVLEFTNVYKAGKMLM